VDGIERRVEEEVETIDSPLKQDSHFSWPLKLPTLLYA